MTKRKYFELKPSDRKKDGGIFCNVSFWHVNNLTAFRPDHQNATTMNLSLLPTVKLGDCYGNEIKFNFF